MEELDPHRPGCHGFPVPGLRDRSRRGRPGDSGGKVGRVSARYHPGRRGTAGRQERGFFQICRLPDLWIGGPAHPFYISDSFGLRERAAPGEEGICLRPGRFRRLCAWAFPSSPGVSGRRAPCIGRISVFTGVARPLAGPFAALPREKFLQYRKVFLRFLPCRTAKSLVHPIIPRR